MARPNPKGAPSAARGASSWVADLEAYNAAAENIPPHSRDDIDTTGETQKKAKIDPDETGRKRTRDSDDCCSG